MRIEKTIPFTNLRALNVKNIVQFVFEYFFNAILSTNISIYLYGSACDDSNTTNNSQLAFS